MVSKDRFGYSITSICAADWSAQSLYLSHQSTDLLHHLDYCVIVALSTLGVDFSNFLLLAGAIASAWFWFTNHRKQLSIRDYYSVESHLRVGVISLNLKMDPAEKFGKSMCVALPSQQWME